jgi:hypothetical protein
VKRNGQCVDTCKWKFCPYYMAKKSEMSGAVVTFSCNLFNEDKDTNASVPACNAKYGLTYEGLP